MHGTWAFWHFLKQNGCQEKCLGPLGPILCIWGLRQREWGVQNVPITKYGVLPLTTLFFENLTWVCIRTSYKWLI